jgi:response regulator RpfG family c-di-GMP phosphodiesterase
MSEISFKRVMSMDKITTALLISDDLDDHQAFTEAFQKLLPTMVVVAVLSQEMATNLLASKKLIPDFVFLDLTSPDSDAVKFLSKLKMVEDGKPISFAIYGNEEELLSNRITGIPSFDKEYEFPQLVKFFKDFIRQRHH